MKREMVVTGYSYVRDGVVYRTTNYHVAKRRSTNGFITTYIALI